MADKILKKEEFKYFYNQLQKVNSNKYTNLNYTTTAVGGIEEGSTFNNMSVQSIFDKMLYPDIEPILTFTSSKTEFESGKPTEITFTWSVDPGTYDPQDFEFEIKSTKENSEFLHRSTEEGSISHSFDSDDVIRCTLYYLDKSIYKELTLTGKNKYYIGVKNTPNANALMLLTFGSKLGKDKILGEYTFNCDGSKRYPYLLVDASDIEGNNKISIKNAGIEFTDYVVTDDVFQGRNVKIIRLGNNDGYFSPVTFTFE